MVCLSPVLGYKILNPIVMRNLHMNYLMIKSHFKAPGNAGIQETIGNLTYLNDSLKKEINDLSSLYIGEKQFSEILLFIEEVAYKNKVKIRDILPGAVQKDSSFKYLKIQIKFDSKFDNLLCFVNELENRKYMFQIEDLKVSGNPENNLWVQSQLNFLIFIKRL